MSQDLGLSTNRGSADKHGKNVYSIYVHADLQKHTWNFNSKSNVMSVKPRWRDKFLRLDKDRCLSLARYVMTGVHVCVFTPLPDWHRLFFLTRVLIRSGNDYTNSSKCNLVNWLCSHSHCWFSKTTPVVINTQPPQYNDHHLTKYWCHLTLWS